MKRSIGPFGLIIVICFVLVAFYPSITAQTEEGICLSWDITGEWNYRASLGGYGTFKFQQATNGTFTATFYNAATGGSGNLSGSIIGASLGFINPASGEDFQGTVDVGGKKMGGTFTYGTQNGTWEATGVAKCLQWQAPPPAGTTRLTIRWGDNIYRTYPGATIPTITFLGTVELSFEAITFGVDLPDRYQVYDEVDGNLNFLGYLNPAGTSSDGGARYTGTVVIRPTGPIGVGGQELHQVKIAFYKSNQSEVLDTGSLARSTQVSSDIGLFSVLQPTATPLPRPTPTPWGGILINQFLIDPSGYIYNSSDNTRIQGVNVSVYEKQNGVFVLWNAVQFLQTNPQVSDEEGRYGWEVPQGDYIVRASKQCYLDVESEEMAIPPPRTDVNLGMSPVGCSGLKVTDVWTTNDQGISDTEFKAGEQIELHSTITNTLASDVTVNVEWVVTNPNGDRVESLSGSGSYLIAPFGTSMKREVTIPSSEASGIYGYLTSLTYQDQTTFMSTQFEVHPSEASHLTYLPIIARTMGQLPPPVGGINGHVTYNGIAALAIELNLRYYNGSTWSTYKTTSTDGNGFYNFTSVESLNPGERYYVGYGPNSDDERYLYEWFCPEITSYTEGDSIPSCDFDISNVNLVSPESYDTVVLPVEFNWSRRDIPGDTYRWRMFDLDNGSISEEWMTADLGDVGSYTLTTLPYWANNNVEYGWDVLVYNSPNSYGSSFYYHSVYFSSSAVNSLAPFISLGGELNKVWKPVP